MTLFANIFLFIFLFTAVAKFSESEVFESVQNVEGFLNSLIQLKNGSDTFTQYATKVQSLFCPEHPICGDVDETSRIDMLRNFSVSIGFGADDSRVKDVSNVVGACCLPCSCDVKTCTGKGNCCLSQLFSDAVSDNLDDDVPNVHGDVSVINDAFSGFQCNETISMHSECIKAVPDSYVDKNVPELE